MGKTAKFVLGAVLVLLFVVLGFLAASSGRKPAGQEFVVARMRPGEYVGEIELLRGGNSIATVRASVEEGAEVAALDPEEFAELIAQSEAAQAAIGQVADERLAESRARREPEDD